MAQIQGWRDRWTPVEGHPEQRGGQGTVIKVTDIKGTVGALKQMVPNSSNSRERRHRFQREVQALQKAQGTQIPRVLDSNVEQADDRTVPLYVVQEWIDGHTLDKRVSTGPMQLDDALSMTRLLAEIVGHCHAHGVVHRDIKPENIVITDHDKPYLVDFGIAWIDPEFRSPEDRKTHVGSELGNRFLRLPELSAGIIDKADRRSDVALLVGILFYLLTGSPPRNLVAGPNGLPPHEAHQDRFLPEVAEDPRFKARLVRLFRVGFQISPELRFQTTQDLIRAIDEMLSPPSKAIPDYERQIAEFEEIRQSAAVRQRESILEGMIAASRALEAALKARADDNGLTTSVLAGSPAIDKGPAVCFVYRIWRHGLPFPQANTHHWIRQKASDVIASYVTNGDTAQIYRYPSDNIAVIDREVIYYEGPAADTERLCEEALSQVGPIFGATLSDLGRALASS